MRNNDVWIRTQSGPRKVRFTWTNTLSGNRKVRFTSETIKEKPVYPEYQDVENGDYYCWDSSKDVFIVCFPSTGKEIINTDEGNDDDDDKMIKVKMDFKIKNFE